MGFPSTAPYMGAPNSVTDPSTFAGMDPAMFTQGYYQNQMGLPSAATPGSGDPMQVLAQWYDPATGGKDEKFRYMAGQLGVDPDKAAAQIGYNLSTYNRGGSLNRDFRNFFKDAAGVAGLAAGGLALGGGFAGAGAAGAGATGAATTAPYIAPGASIGGSTLGGAGAATLAPYAATGGSITGSALGASGSGLGSAGAAGGLGGTGAAAGAAGMGLKDWIALGGNLLGGLGGAQAAKEATNASTAADQAAIGEIRRQFDLTRSDQAPYQAAGVNALGQLSNPNANFMASPDYGFRRSEGMRDIGNSFSARGGAQSGNALKALADYNSSLASGEFGNWWNRQSSLAGLGQTANAQTGTLGANAANNVGSLMNNQGNTRVSGVLGRYGSVYGGLSDALNNWLYRHP